MCKWPWCGLWLSHHIATYLCSNFTSSTDLLEVNTPTTSNVTKWDAIHSDWQYLLEIWNNKFGNWRGCPIYGPFPHRPFHRGFWVCGYQAQGMKSSSTFFDTRLGVFYKVLYLMVLNWMDSDFVPMICQAAECIGQQNFAQSGCHRKSLTPPNKMLAHIVLMFLQATRNLKRRWLEIGCGGFMYTSGDWILGSTMNLFGEQFIPTLNFDLPCNICFSWRYTTHALSRNGNYSALTTQRVLLMSSTTSLWHDEFNTRPHEEPNDFFVCVVVRFATRTSKLLVGRKQRLLALTSARKTCIFDAINALLPKWTVLSIKFLWLHTREWVRWKWRKLICMVSWSACWQWSVIHAMIPLMCHEWCQSPTDCEWACVCRSFSAWNSIVLSAVLVWKWKATSLQVLLHHGTCTKFSVKRYHPHIFWCQEIKTDRLAWCGKWRDLLHHSERVIEGFTSIK